MAIPYASNRVYQPDSSIIDIIMQSARQKAESQRAGGQIWGNTVGNLGQIAGGTIRDIAERKRQAPIEAARLQGETTRNELAGLQLQEAKKQAEKRAKREAAMQLPHRQEVLSALGADPEGQAEAAEHFGKLDDYFDSMMGEAAAGVARAGFQPFAFQAALKDLEAKGMDKAKLGEYAAVFESDPEKAKALTYQLLSNSPNAKHQAIFAEAQQTRLKDAEIAAQKERDAAENALKATDDKRADLMFAETQRHNRAIENKETRGQFQVIDGVPVIVGQNGVATPVKNPDGKPIINSSQPSKSTAFIGQPGYAKLTTKQKSQADSLNALVASMDDYRNLIETTSDATGLNLAGTDAADLDSAANGISFAAAQAEGTGALQAADREVIEKMIPNGTSINPLDVFNTLRKGGKAGQFKALDTQREKYARNLAALGLAPVRSDGKAKVPAGDGQGLPNGTRVAAPQPDGLTWTAPDGQVIRFKNKASLDGFLKSLPKQ